MATAVVIAAALAACGGGGGGGGSTPPVTTPTPGHTATPTPTPAPTLDPFGCVGSVPSSVARKPMVVYPTASGDTFSYSGTLSDTFAESAPCPQPTATDNASVKVNVSESATSSPAGATDSTSVETDAYTKRTTTLTTHQTLVSSSTALLLYATSSSDEINNTITTTYATPQILDTLPASSGATWSNQPAATISEHLADGTSIARTVKNDGSYTDTEHFPGASPATISIDGAATGKPLDGGGSYAFSGVTFKYAPPSGGNITVTIDSGTSSKTRTFPAWFSVPSSYITDSFVDNGAKTFDPNCATAGAISAAGDHQVVETYQVLDPVLGYKETRVTTSYVVNGFGAACVKIDDTLNSYYDYQTDTTKVDYQSQNGQPNSVDHLVEYLGMTAPTSPYPALRTQSVRAVTPTAVAQAVAAIAHTRVVQQARLLRQLHSYALHFSRTGATR